MKDELQGFVNFLDVVSKPSPQQLIVLTMYATVEGRNFANEVATGIMTIEHQRNVLEAIYQMAGKALGKL